MRREGRCCLGIYGEAVGSATPLYDFLGSRVSEIGLIIFREDATDEKIEFGWEERLHVVRGHEQ